MRRSLAVIGIIFCLILSTSFSIQSTNANQEIEEEKSQAEKELEELKADRGVHESQISDLETKFLNLDTQIRDIISQQEKVEKDIQTINKKVAKLKALTPELLEQREGLLSELYIISDDKLFYLTYFISADRFFDLLKGKDETQIVMEEKIRKIGLIDQVLELITKREKLYDKKITDLKSQKQELTGRIVLIHMELQKQQKSLESIDLRSISLQQYLLSLGKMNVLLERDFVGWNRAEGDSFVFVGGGTEHGIGMSQHGAAGLARLGKNYQEILGHYYQNTKIGQRDTSGVNVRIGIVLGGAGGKIYARGGSAHMAGIIIGQDDFVQVSPAIGHAIIRPDSPATYFEVDYKTSGYNQYYGFIEVKNVGGSLFTINHINIEQYLKGVVPAEMPRSWPLEALKTQAVAARAYALRQIKPEAIFDMDDTTRFQVYLGKKYQFAATDKAVDETAGQVVMYGSEIIPCYYHSTSGGYTENNENVWGGRPRPYLRGVPSPWEENSPWWSWQSKTFSRQELSEILGRDERTNIGLLQKIEIINRGISGRVIAVKLSGSEGQKIITGQTLRRVINLNIAVFEPPIRSILFGIRNP